MKEKDFFFLAGFTPTQLFEINYSFDLIYFLKAPYQTKIQTEKDLSILQLGQALTKYIT